MKEYRTVKGYLNAIKRLEHNQINCLKGFDKLTDKQKEALQYISGDISNGLGEFEK